MTTPSSAEEPWPVRVVAKKISDWIARLGSVWVEGQVAQLSLRPGTRTAFLTLRDPAADISLSVTCGRDVLDRLRPPLREGARVVVLCRPDYYIARGQLSLRASDIRPVGIGELLARLERLKQLMAAEGLFDPGRKRRLPFLPNTVGLITGRASAAERDVLENARRRWPMVRFKILNCAVQGPGSAGEVIGAMKRLDGDPDVDVIVIARGGGSVEDLLPFSDEALCRAVVASRTPVISAIGHEPDTPLLDYVADVRCSTPTDAGKRVVPDVVDELAKVDGARNRARRVITGRIEREYARLDTLRARPIFADPHTLVEDREAGVHALRDRARRTLRHRLEVAAGDLEHTRARVTALSPAATLARGYAVVQRADGSVVRAAAEVETGERLGVRLAEGHVDVVVTDPPATDL